MLQNRASCKPLLDAVLQGEGSGDEDDDDKDKKGVMSLGEYMKKRWLEEYIKRESGLGGKGKQEKMVDMRKMFTAARR